MKLIARETTLVIAGAWNPAIMTPEWVLSHGLQKDLAGTNKVQAAIPVGLLFEFPRFGLEDLAYIARTDALILFPSATTEDSFATVETVAKRTLDQLSHTPVTGVGYNFEFQDDAPEPAMLQALSIAQKDIVDIAPAGFAVASNAIATSLKREQVVINIQRYFDGTRLGVKFNFHYSVNSASQASRALSGEDGYERFHQNYCTAKHLVQQLYGDVSDDENDQ